jgi:3-deoxy-D-manno-octulosonic-acid transferase
MKTVWLLLYNMFVVPFLYAGFYSASLVHKKLKAIRIGKRGQHARIQAAVAKLDPARKRVLFHCTSVGEWEQAVPIIEGLKRIHPELCVLLSFSSPSGYQYFKTHPQVDLKTYLPLDTYWGAKKFFKTLQPDLWFISKFDVWPNHVFVAERLRIPVILTAATLSANSRRDKGLAKWLHRGVYTCIDLIFPIAEDDRTRFLKLYPFPERLIVTGDTRFDRVFQKSEAVRKSDDIPVFIEHDGLKIIAGSIWPTDEKHLLPALINLLKKYEELKVILVPHELHESHMLAIENTLTNASLKSERYTEFAKKGGTNTRVAIINTIGLLARLYKQSDIAYVGGGFGVNVHNVMEPAVFGQPVLFGPRCVNSFEAGELVKIGSGHIVKNSTAIEEKLEEFITDPNACQEAGKKAAELIKNNVGATETVLQTLRKRYDFIS